MRIGIDIDETIVDTAVSFSDVVKKYNININKGYHDNLTRKELDCVFTNHMEEVVLNAKIKKDVEEVLNSLKDLGHELIIITSRSNHYSKNIESITYDFIKKYELPISKIYFGQRKKSDLCKKINIDLMIDDDKNVYKNMKEDNIECILFNDEIKTWKEVLKYIKKVM